MEEDAEALIWTAAGGAAVAGFLNPVPIVGDVLILVGTWGTMLIGLAKIYDVDFDLKTFKIMAFEALRSVGVYAMGTLAFIYVMKFSGFGTFPAALTNAALNFGFTAGVGFMYGKAWKDSIEPTAQDIVKLLIDTIKFFKKGFTKEKRSQMSKTYQQNINQGKSKKQSLAEILKVFFTEFFD